MMKRVLPLLILALFLAAIVAPFASSWPDGLERIAQMLGFDHLASKNPPLKALVPDYTVHSLGNRPMSTAVAGVVGTLLCFFLPFGLYLFRKK